MSKGIQDILPKLILLSYNETCEADIGDNDSAKQNKKRSSTFIRHLGNHIHGAIRAKDPSAKIEVLCGDGRPSVFKRKEYLFDIHAFEYAFFQSPVHKK